MMHPAKFALAASFLVLSTAVWADDLTGKDRFLCSAGTLAACTEDGICFKESPASFDLPQFLEVDMGKKRLSSTKASGRDRSAEIVNLDRKNGRIVLQGVQGDRAFTLVIAEDTGLMSASVTFDGFNIGVFGACTPMNDSK